MPLGATKDSVLESAVQFVNDYKISHGLINSNDDLSSVRHSLSVSPGSKLPQASKPRKMRKLLVNIHQNAQPFGEQTVSPTLPHPSHDANGATNGVQSGMTSGHVSDMPLVEFNTAAPTAAPGPQTYQPHNQYSTMVHSHSHQHHLQQSTAPLNVDPRNTGHGGGQPRLNAYQQHYTSYLQGQPLMDTEPIPYQQHLNGAHGQQQQHDLGQQHQQLGQHQRTYLSKGSCAWSIPVAGLGMAGAGNAAVPPPVINSSLSSYNQPHHGPQTMVPAETTPQYQMMMMRQEHQLPGPPPRPQQELMQPVQPSLFEQPTFDQVRYHGQPPTYTNAPNTLPLAQQRRHSNSHQ
jgi:hypothetical protein